MECGNWMRFKGRIVIPSPSPSQVQSHSPAASRLKIAAFS